MGGIYRDFLLHKGVGCVHFDAALVVTQTAPPPEIDPKQGGALRPGASLLEAFPELVGYEATIAEIIAGKLPAFQIDFVNRETDDGHLAYYHFLLMVDEVNRGGVLFIEDVTDQARMHQQINQKRYDARLLAAREGDQHDGEAGKLIGDAPAMQDLRADIEKISRVPAATVLLQGESGTGKTLVARTIHYRTFAPTAPLVEINCAALPEHLIEAELFGHEKGAFTHASQSRKGLLEEAEGGTMFFDEIAELPIKLQAKLLSAIENKRYRRIGGNREESFHARVIAATNRDLATEVAESRFRQDLFYRLNVASLTLPPLRQLGSDILILARKMLRDFAVDFKKRVTDFTPAAEKMLIGHTWPGNVRELRNCIERAMIFADEGDLDAPDLQITPAPPADQDGARQWHLPPEGMPLNAVERQMIASALEQTRGNKTLAAKMLGLTRDALRYRMEKHGLTGPPFG